MKLHYFDGYGKGDMIRMALHTAKQEFEDVRYSQEQWAVEKATGHYEFGQVPAMEMDGKFYGQSCAILRYHGKKHGFYSEDPYTAWRMDSYIDSIMDIMNGFYKFAFEQNEEKKKADAETYFTTIFPAWMNVIEKRFAANDSPHHAVGDKVTIADFALCGWMFGTPLNEGSPLCGQFKEIVAKFPLVSAYLTHTKENGLKEFLEKRPQPRPF
jgi:glutathione S-transferase